MSDAFRFDYQTMRTIIDICHELTVTINGGELSDLHDVAIRFGGTLGIDDLDEFAVAKFESAINSGLVQAFDAENSQTLAAIFASMCEPVMTAVVQYARGGSNPAECITKLNESCLANSGQIQSILQQMLGIPDNLATPLSEHLGQYAVSIYCFAAAYKIYQSAARDAALAEERRIEIERLSEEAIAGLKAQRKKMDDLVNGFLLDRLEPFGNAIAAMDETILENDDDGFIRANAELWELFGRTAQYSSAAEFDDLMLSDEAFKL